VIYADPPWQYEHMISLSREIEEHYPTMSQEDICAMPVPSMAARDCVLFLWVPPSLIQQGLAVMEAWGFGYRTLIIWDKGSIGPGYWVRQQAELLLIGVRGKPATPEPDARPSSMFRAKRGRHSEKPAGMYEIIETMYPNAQRVELFARNRRTGWDGWGNELRG
jgi:N6-adenosine-specific RNA methylase IME4